MLHTHTTQNLLSCILAIFKTLTKNLLFHILKYGRIHENKSNILLLLFYLFTVAYFFTYLLHYLFNCYLHITFNYFTFNYFT